MTKKSGDSIVVIAIEKDLDHGKPPMLHGASMTRLRASGPLDPLFAQVPHGRVTEVARLVGVCRQTILRWQNGNPISPYWRMRLELIALARGIDPLFPEPQTFPAHGGTRERKTT